MQSDSLTQKSGSTDVAELQKRLTDLTQKITESINQLNVSSPSQDDDSENEIMMSYEMKVARTIDELRYNRDIVERKLMSLGIKVEPMGNGY